MIIGSGVFAATLIFNLYKYNLFLYEDEYKIFPWMEEGQKSNSFSLWLMIHLTVALLLQFVTFIRIEDESIGELHNKLHYIFSTLVLINIWNFGQYPWHVAVLLQGTLLAIMQWRRKGYIYFFALSSAPLLEMMLYIIS